MSNETEQRVSRASREAVEWFARYRFEGAYDEQWHRCRVVDVSDGGAGLDLFGSVPVRSGGRLVVELDAPQHAGILVTGEVTFVGKLIHFGPGLDGARVGVEFLDMTPPARQFLESVLAARLSTVA